MLSLPISLDAILDPHTRLSLDRIATAQESIAENLLRLTQIVSASRFSFSLKFGGLEVIYKNDHVDFDLPIVIAATDAEGETIPDAPIPTGFTLTVTSDNAGVVTVTPDAGGNLKLFRVHVGTSGQANVTANLMDAASNLVATGAEQVTVTTGDPAAISSITMNFPE